MTASSELDLKQRLAKLSERERRDMSAYLLRLKHQSKSGRAGISKLMKDMDAGKKTKQSQLASDYCHGQAILPHREATGSGGLRSAEAHEGTMR